MKYSTGELHRCILQEETTHGVRLLHARRMCNSLLHDSDHPATAVMHFEPSTAEYLKLKGGSNTKHTQKKKSKKHKNTKTRKHKNTKTRQHKKAEFNYVISGNNGGWWRARSDQIEAYNAFFSPDQDQPTFKYTTRTGDYYYIRSRSEGQSNRWHEIQDRTSPHKWRMIRQLDKAPMPSDT